MQGSSFWTSLLLNTKIGTIFRVAFTLLRDICRRSPDDGTVCEKYTRDYEVYVQRCQSRRYADNMSYYVSALTADDVSGCRVGSIYLNQLFLIVDKFEFTCKLHSIRIAAQYIRDVVFFMDTRRIPQISCFLAILEGKSRIFDQVKVFRQWHVRGLCLGIATGRYAHVREEDQAQSRGKFTCLLF